MTYEVRIGRRDGFASIEMFIVEHHENGMYYITPHGEGTFKRTRAEEGMKISPFLTLPWDDEGLIRAMSEEMNRFLGKPDETFVRGKLEATEKHLEDMRKLVRIPK